MRIYVSHVGDSRLLLVRGDRYLSEHNTGYIFMGPPWGSNGTPRVERQGDEKKPSICVRERAKEKKGERARKRERERERYDRCSRDNQQRGVKLSQKGARTTAIFKASHRLAPGRRNAGSENSLAGIHPDEATHETYIREDEERQEREGRRKGGQSEW